MVRFKPDRTGPDQFFRKKRKFKGKKTGLYAGPDRTGFFEKPKSLLVQRNDFKIEKYCKPLPTHEVLKIFRNEQNLEKKHGPYRCNSFKSKYGRVKLICKKQHATYQKSYPKDSKSNVYTN